MFVEGIYLYLFVVKVYNVTNKVKICHGVSWGKAMSVFNFVVRLTEIFLQLQTKLPVKRSRHSECRVVLKLNNL